MSAWTTPSEILYAKGFAWNVARLFDPVWVIQLPHYGGFLFHGSEEEAETMRAHKANWEHEIAHKRPASIHDFPTPNGCWNHRGFLRTRKLNGRYWCECASCSSVRGER